MAFGPRDEVMAAMAKAAEHAAKLEEKRKNRANWRLKLHILDMIELLKKLTNRQGKIISRRKSGCSAVSQYAVARAIKRARFMALIPYVGE